MKRQKDAIEMEGHVNAFSESGLSLRKYCMDHSLSEAVMRYWKAKFEKNKSPGKFTLVQENGVPYQNSVLLSIQFKNGVELLIYKPLDPEYLRQLMGC